MLVVVQDRCQERVPDCDRIRADGLRHRSTVRPAPVNGDIPGLALHSSRCMRAAQPSGTFENLLQIAQQVGVAEAVGGLLRPTCPVGGEAVVHDRADMLGPDIPAGPRR